MKKIKIFTNHYYPENFKINELSEEFSKHYKVEVITQIPNYSKPGFFDGFGFFKKHTNEHKGVRIKRLAVLPRKNNRFMLFANYLSYIISSFFYSLLTKDKADHVFVYVTSPIFISWSALRFAKKNQVKSTLYLLDLWPDSLISVLNIKNKILIKFLENSCKKIYGRFDNIFVSSFGFIEVLVSYGIPKSKIHYVPQHASNEVRNEDIENARIDTLKVVFTGNVGEAQGLGVLIETAAKLKSMDFKKVHFLIVGDGSFKSTLESKIQSLSLQEFFTFQDYVVPKEIPKILSENHFGFVSLKNSDVFNRTLPAKVQSYMSYGIPILGSANGEIPFIIEKAKCGFVAPADDATALANLVIDLQKLDLLNLEELSKNGYNYSKVHFDINKIVKKFMNVIES